MPLDQKSNRMSSCDIATRREVMFYLLSILGYGLNVQLDTFFAHAPLPLSEPWREILGESASSVSPKLAYRYNLILGASVGFSIGTNAPKLIFARNSGPMLR